MNFPAFEYAQNHPAQAQGIIYEHGYKYLEPPEWGADFAERFHDYTT